MSPSAQMRRGGQGCPMTTPLRALALVCSLKPSPAASSTDLIARQVLEELAGHDVTGEVVRVVDHDVKPGVEKDMGDGDAWPAIREKVLAADVLVLATPTWMGQASSVCMRVLERLDAELSETDDQGRPSVFGKVAGVAVVGNEDGAHHISLAGLPGAQRRRLHDPGAGEHLLERRGHARHRLPGPRRDPRGHRRDERDGRREPAHLARLLQGANFPGEAAEERSRLRRDAAPCADHAVPATPAERTAVTRLHDQRASAVSGRWARRRSRRRARRRR